MKQTYNWTKLDVAIINKKLATQSLYKHKGVVFFKPLVNGPDEHHTEMAAFVDNIGGACFVYYKHQSLVDYASDTPGTVADQILEMAEVDEDGKFLAIMLSEAIFKPEHDDKRLFVIAHEMAHLHFGDYLNEENRIEVQTGGIEQELRADAYSIELLDSKDQAASLFGMFVPKINAILANDLPEDVRAQFTKLYSGLITRQEAIL